MTSHPELELYDVVVIGAGPVGKMAALLLGRAGHSVLSVERKADDYPLPRAVGHDAEIARLWQSAGLPPDRMSDAVEAYDDLYVWTNGVGDVLQEIDLRGIGTSAWNNAYFYHQPGLESHLARAVGEQSTVETRRGVEAHIVDQDADAVTVSLSSAGGSAATTVRARYVIGADGAKSSTRTSVDIDWNDLGFFFDWLVVDVLPGEGFEVTNVAKQICDPERPTAQVPRARAGGAGSSCCSRARIPASSNNLNASGSYSVTSESHLTRLRSSAVWSTPSALVGRRPGAGIGYFSSATQPT